MSPKKNTDTMLDQNNYKVDQVKSILRVEPLVLFASCDGGLNANQYNYLQKALLSIEAEMITCNYTYNYNFIKSIIPQKYDINEFDAVVDEKPRQILKCLLNPKRVTRIAAQQYLQESTPTNETLLDCFNGVGILIYSKQVIPITTKLLTALSKHHINVNVIKMYSTFYLGANLDKIVEFSDALYEGQFGPLQATNVGYYLTTFVQHLQQTQKNTVKEQVQEQVIL